MRITVSNTITVENPTVKVKEWARKHLVIPNPEYAKKLRMNFWLGNTPRNLMLYEQHGSDLVLPYGTLKDLLEISDTPWIIPNFANAGKVDYGPPVPLYDYQQEAVEAMRTAKYGILKSPAGSGKTQMGIALAKAYERKALWLTHTHDLLQQSKQRAEQYMDPSLIGTITEGKVDIGRGITFATIQTMCRLDLLQYRNEWDVVIVDECFPGQTQITTKHGLKRIDQIHIGEDVLTINNSGDCEYRKVTKIFQKKPSTLMRLILKDGRCIYCTTNHPILTKHGYVKAEKINEYDEVCCLRERIRSQNIKQNSEILHKKGGTGTTLFKRMLSYISKEENRMDTRKTGNFSANNNSFESCYGFRPDESEQSIKERICSEQNLRYTSEKESQTANPGREWTGFDDTASNSNGKIRTSLSRSRIRCDNAFREERFTESLQGRHCNQSGKDSYRNRRPFSLRFESTKCGSKKKRLLEWVRVDSVEVQKSGSDGEFGSMCPGGIVYNLEIEGNHNYFANGMNVHNCHRVAGTPTAMTQFSKVLNNLAARHKFGLSATVHRADDMIEATYALLGRVAYTVPEEAVAERIMKVGIRSVGTGTTLSRECLNADGTLNYTKMISSLCENNERNQVIARYIKREENHPCLILSDRLEHLSSLMLLLYPSMLNEAVMISGKTKKALREKAIEDMRTGKKKYLFATYSLAKEGLDIPRLERLFLTTPQKDYAIITQAIGRIARTHPDKEAPVAYDFVDNIQYLARAYKKRCTIYRKNHCYFVEG